MRIVFSFSAGGRDAGAAAGPPGRPALRRLAAASLVAAALAGCGGGDDPAPAGAGDPAAGPVDDAFAGRAVQAANALRAQPQRCGDATLGPVPPLQWSPPLADAALTHSQNMREADALSHSGPEGEEVTDRAADAGYPWRAIAENIAGGQPDLDAVMRAWIESPEHCLNLMSGDYRDLGLAQVPGAAGNTYGTYWTMVLASR